MTTATRPQTTRQQPLTGCVVVTSPGTVDMVAISSLARATKRPVAALATSIYQAPSVLLEEVPTEHLDAVLEPCRRLGLEVEAHPAGYQPPTGGQRYDLAVHIIDPTVILDTVATASQILGVGVDDAYKVLATPPGLLLGDLSEASASALGRRFGDGVAVSISPSDQGPFDLFVDPDTPRTPALTKLVDQSTGLVELGLDREQAEQQFTRLPRGSTRLIARKLIPFDLVLTSITSSEAGPDTAAWLADRFGIESDLFATVLCSAPIALAEGVTRDEADRLADEGRRVGLELTVEAAAFGLYTLTVVQTADHTAMGDVLTRFNLPVPRRLPSVVKSGLSDLDARWLGHLLQTAGCEVSFDEEAS